jgi:hypothetical protein
MRLVGALRAFAGREEAVEEAFAQPGNARLNARDFDHINAAAEHKSPFVPHLYIYILNDEKHYIVYSNEQGRITSSLLLVFALKPEILWDDNLPHIVEIVMLVDAMLEEIKKK